jgi:hypothetical protein
VGYGVTVMDGFRLPLAGRVGLPLAVLLALLWGGTSAGPGMASASPAQPTVRAAAGLQSVILGHHAHVVRPAAGHPQRSRRGFAPVAVLVAALAGTVVAATQRRAAAPSARLDSWLLPVRPRAPPSRQL